MLNRLAPLPERHYCRYMIILKHVSNVAVNLPDITLSLSRDRSGKLSALQGAAGLNRGADD
jgi:hypothetical protein